jgi:hypothetical protein
MIEHGKTYIGIVEDNQDPKKLGRCRVRVVDIFDEIPVEDIPWASPWKDLNGNGFNVPEKGKIVTVIFDAGNIYKPEYIYSEHYNINLEKKLKTLEGKDYTSMKSLIYDHKTQIYVNDKDKLVLDYKFQQINIKDEGIDLNLKDNNGRINIGNASANQEAILGTNFLLWFDEFVDNLLGSRGGPFLGNLGSPVVPNPDFITCLQKYKAKKDPKFLSKNVFLNDNGYIDSSVIPIQSERITEGELGDKWKSTVRENDLVEKESTDFGPKAATQPSGTLTPPSGTDDTTDLDNQGEPEGRPEPASSESNPDADILIKALKKKNYVVFEKPFEMNIVGVRYNKPGQPYTNKFNDRLYVFYKNDQGSWKLVWWPISTVPGKYGSKDEYPKGSTVKGQRNQVLHKDLPKMDSRGGIGILKPAQYLNLWVIGEYKEEKALRPTNQKFYRDTNKGNPNITYSKEGIGNAGMLIHKAFNRSQGPNTYGVGNWSEGCQVIPNPSHLDQFFGLLEKHKNKYGNKFTYTLIISDDVQNL